MSDIHPATPMGSPVTDTPTETAILASYRTEVDRLRKQLGDLPAELNEARARLATTAAELRELTGYHDELLEDVLRNAGDEFDHDDAADAIAVRYVRWLEAERDRHVKALARCADEKYPGEAVTVARQALEG